MFLKHSQITPERVSDILTSAEAAARALPPAFPLEATVAVNPFLGQSDEDLATTAARLARVGGVSVTLPRAEYAARLATGQITDDDLAAALVACASPLKPINLSLLKARLHAPSPTPKALPTVADLAARATGIDWPAIVARTVGLWAAGYFDKGQALWTPTPGRSAYAAWQDWASRDLTPEIAGLAGFCAHAAEAPDTPERAILRAAERLGLTAASAETAFHRLFMDLGGWSQHARWLLWQAEAKGRSDDTLPGLLALRLVWEEALLAQVPVIAEDWSQTVSAHATPITPSADHVLDMILQDAAERAHQRGLATKLAIGKTRTARPDLQAAFCIDVRSEVFRRALEAQHPGIETIGAAGFFLLPVAHRAHGTDLAASHLPVLLQPALSANSHAGDSDETEARISARAVRAWGRFRQAAVSSFAFIEAAGPIYAGKLVRDALGLGHGRAKATPAPRFDAALPAAQKADIAAGALRAMGLTQGLARLVLLVGHGAQVTNTPHESAYHCGACGGQTGDVSARLLAQLLNDPETRETLAARGISLPKDTLFMAGLHDTTTDRVTLYPDIAAPDHRDDIAAATRWLKAAGAETRAERATRLPGARPADLFERARNWAELRPEWGLAGCSAFIAAPRAITADSDLDGRAFLHSYDWTTDEGFKTLELILTAPVVVASWISLQYYGSSVAPEAFGSGNKLIHNVTGGIGVVQGNGGRLRAGLPWQAVHSGDALVHDPLRLTVMVEAPKAAIMDVLARHDSLRALFDNGWLHLLALEGGKIAGRYRGGLEWAPVPAADTGLAV